MLRVLIQACTSLYVIQTKNLDSKEIKVCTYGQKSIAKANTKV